MLTNVKFENPWDEPKGNSGSKKSNKPVNNDIEEILKKSQEKIFSFLNNNKQKKYHKNSHQDKPNIKKLILLLLSIIVLLWLATGIFTVDTKEVGVIIRFGVYDRTVGPGLNYKLPSPIEMVQKVNVTTVRKDVIGKITNPINVSRYSFSKNNKSADEQSLSYPKESQMLTADENIIDMHFFVQWKINNAKDYLFNIKPETEDIVRSSAESAMRQVIGVFEMHKALSEQRFKIEQEVKSKLQDILDRYKAGIQILAVGIEYNYVAPEVKDAYWDVQSAKADREKEINQALAYKNALLPKAKGEAQSHIEEALAYKEAKIEEAKGRAERFNEVYKEYSKSKEVTKKRMYIETIEKVLKDVDKVIIDKNVAKNVLPYLPVDKIQSTK